MSGSNDEPGDVVRSDPHQTDLISPVVDERSRTAGAGPGGGAPQVDEGRPGELSYLGMFPSDDRLLRKSKIFLKFLLEKSLLEIERIASVHRGRRCQAWPDWSDTAGEREISTSWLRLLTELSPKAQIQFPQLDLTPPDTPAPARKK